jgi:hypothetical protein
MNIAAVLPPMADDGLFTFCLPKDLCTIVMFETIIDHGLPPGGRILICLLIHQEAAARTIGVKWIMFTSDDFDPTISIKVSGRKGVREVDFINLASFQSCRAQPPQTASASGENFFVPITIDVANYKTGQVDYRQINV